MRVVEIHKKEPADDADHVLEQAKGKYKEVFVIGLNKEGQLDVRSNKMAASSLLWLIECFKHNLLSGCYAEEQV